MESLGRQLDDASKHNQRSAFDSELSLVLVEGYPLDGWVKNPYFVGFQQRKLSVTKDEVLMVSRLDGPDPETVRRIIDDSINTEKTGLKGRAYFDAKCSKPDEKNASKSPADWYDLSIHRSR